MTAPDDESSTTTHTRCPECDLSSLVRRVAHGDADAFADLYDHTADRLFGAACEMLADRDRATDVVEECYREVWHGARRYDPSRGTALSWVLGIGHRLAVEQIRSARQSDGAPARPDVDHIAGARILRGLPSREGQALQLAYHHGWTYRQIAVTLGVSPARAAAMLRGGLMRMTW